MLGPAYGGAVIELWGWRAIFWLNVPQAAAIAAVAAGVPLRSGETREPGWTIGERWFSLTRLALLCCYAWPSPTTVCSDLSSWTPLGVIRRDACCCRLAALVVVCISALTAQPLLSAALLLQARAFLTGKRGPVAGG